MNMWYQANIHSIRPGKIIKRFSFRLSFSVKEIPIICYFSKCTINFCAKFIFWRLDWHFRKTKRHLCFVISHCSTPSLKKSVWNVIKMINKHYVAFSFITTVSEMKLWSKSENNKNISQSWKIFQGRGMGNLLLLLPGLTIWM